MYCLLCVPFHPLCGICIDTKIDLARLSAHLGIAEGGGDGNEHPHVCKISPGASLPAFCSLSAPPSLAQQVHARHQDCPLFTRPPDEGRGPENADQRQETGEDEAEAPPQSHEDAEDVAALSRERAPVDDSRVFTEARIHPAALSLKQSKYLFADPVFPSSRTSSFSPRDADAERERIAAEWAAAKAAYTASLMHLTGGSIDDEPSNSPASTHEQLIVDEAIIGLASLQQIVISKLAGQRPTMLDDGSQKRSDASKAACLSASPPQVDPAQTLNASKSEQDEDALAQDASPQTQARSRLRLAAAAPVQRQHNVAQSHSVSCSQGEHIVPAHGLSRMRAPCVWTSNTACVCECFACGSVDKGGVY